MKKINLFNIFSKVKGIGRNVKRADKGCMKLAFGSKEGDKGAVEGWAVVKVREGDGGVSCFNKYHFI